MAGFLAGLPVPMRIALLGCSWGSSFLFVHLALVRLNSLQVASGRMLIALVILGGISLAAAGKVAFAPVRRVSPGLLVSLGVLNCAVPFLLIATAQNHVPSAVAAIFNSATPLLTLIIAVAVGYEARPRLLQMAGILLGILGVATMFGFAATEGPVLARLALLGAAASYSIAFVLARNAQLQRVDGITLACVQCGIGFAILVVPTLVASMPVEQGPTLGALFGLAGVAMVSTAFPYLIYFDLVRDAGPSATALSTYLVPVVGMLLGWIFLGEKVGAMAAAGAAMVIAGVVLARRFGAVMPRPDQVESTSEPVTAPLRRSESA